MNFQSDNGHIVLLLGLLVGALLADHFWKYPGAEQAVITIFGILLFKLDPKAPMPMLGTKTSAKQETVVEQTEP